MNAIFRNITAGLRPRELMSLPRWAGLSAARAAVGRFLGLALEGLALEALVGKGFAGAAAERREGLLGLGCLAPAGVRATEVLRFTGMDRS
ncbi:MAG: hypothetical protein ABI895_35395 [Deltaproteobacteria bacterium]